MTQPRAASADLRVASALEARSRSLGAWAASPTLLRVLGGLAVLATVAVIVTWVFTVAERVESPYPIEWQEGAIVAHAFRLLDGLPLYIAPSRTFIPVLYPPFGYVVQSWAMELLGRGLPAARAVSLTASVLIALIIAGVIMRRTRSRLAALVAAGIFFAAYDLCFAWYDEARVDMLFILLGLSSLVFLTRERRSTAIVVSSGLLAALAILTKQQGLVFAAAGFGHLLFRSWRQALIFGATIAAVIIPTVIVLQISSNGWFIRETWTYLSRYPLRRDYLRGAIMGMVMVAIPLGCATAWVWAGVRSGDPKRLVSVWSLGLAGVTIAGFSSMLHDGGTTNHLIPIVVMAVIMQGMLLGDLERAGRRPRALAGLLGLALVPFAIWPWPFEAALSPDVRAAQKKVVAEIAGLPGEVFVLEDSFYGWLAGKRMNPDGSSLRSLSYLGLELPPEIVTGLVNHRYEAVVLSYRSETKRVRSIAGNRLNRLISENYAFSHTIVADSEEARILRIPRHVYLPRRLPPVSRPGSARPPNRG